MKKAGSSYLLIHSQGNSGKIYQQLHRKVRQSICGFNIDPFFMSFEEPGLSTKCRVHLMT